MEQFLQNSSCLGCKSFGQQRWVEEDPPDRHTSQPLLDRIEEMPA